MQTADAKTPETTAHALTPEEAEELENWTGPNGRPLNPDELYEREMSRLTRQADKDFREFKQRMQENPELAILALNHLEPHLDNFRAHMQLLDSPGYERALVPFNWSFGTTDTEIMGVTPRVMLRQAVYHTSVALACEAMTMGQGRKADTDKLKDIYLAMASARWADEILNGAKRGRKPAAKRPKPELKPRGGARAGAGRPRKSPTLRSISRISDDEEDDNSDAEY